MKMNLAPLTAKSAAKLRRAEHFREVYGSLALGHSNLSATARFFGVSSHFVARVRQYRMWEFSKASRSSHLQLDNLKTCNL